LLLGGKSRTDASVPAKTEAAVASKMTSPRIHVVRLSRSAGVTVSNVTALRPKAS